MNNYFNISLYTSLTHSIILGIDNVSSETYLLSRQSLVLVYTKRYYNDLV